MMLPQFWNNWSIARLTLFMVLAPLLIVSAILTYYQVHGRFQDMLDTLEIQGSIIADHVASDSEHYMFTGNKEKLQLIIDDAVQQADIAYLKVIDLENNVIVSTDSEHNSDAIDDVFEITRPIIYRDIVVDDVNQEMAPLDVVVGHVFIELSPETINHKKETVLFNSLIILLGGLIISVALAFLISRNLVIPLKKIHFAVEKISKGVFDTKLSVQKSGEFGELESGINKMASELQLSNKHQQKRIDDATQALMELVLQLEQKNVLLDEARKEAEEIGNSKVEFLANMSHEIRTPLNAVIGASDLLMNIVKDDSADKYMSTLSVASRQLNSVVDDILDFSRMEANKLELEYLSFDIIEVLEGVVSLHTPLAHEKNLELILQVESDMPALIFGDPMRISQVVSNLVSNAIKFTNKGKVLVSVSSVAINNTNIRLQINVIDTGAGLTEIAQERLFDAFSQANNTVARKYGGSGLGLAIVRKLVEQMQGFINVKSIVGNGTEFNVYLDLRVDSRKRVEYEKKLSGMTVLLYEKDRMTEEAVIKTLDYWGIEAVVCKSDDDFIGHLMKQKTDGANCDCIIMGMGHNSLLTNSIEDCIGKIRHLSQMPVILMLNDREYVIPTQIIDKQVCWLGKSLNRHLLYTKLESINNHDENIANQLSDACSSDVLANTSAAFKNLNILIAEDNDFNRELLTDMLLAFGARVEAVEDGQYAVEAALKGSFDIIFLDLHMPRKDGITAANEIKFSNLEKSPFLIAATADVFIKDQGEDVDVFDSFVFKPIREEVLLEKVTTLLNFQGEYPKADNKKGGTADESQTEDADNAFSEKLDREVRKLVLQIVENSNNDNYPEIQNYSHQLRGVCGFYELTEMTIVAAGLEKAAKDKRRSDIVLLIKVLLKQLKISPDYKRIH